MQDNEFSVQVSYGVLAGLRWIKASSQYQTPILALHGWLDNANSFVPLAQYLTQTCSELVALDLAGHGHSQHRAPGSRYHMLDYVFDIVDAVNQFGWERFTLLGHSLGAGIASLIAAAIPEKLDRLVLIDGIGPISNQINQVTEQLKKSIDLHQRLGPRLTQATYPDWNTLIERRANIGNISIQSAERLVKRNATMQDGKIVWLADPRLKLLSPMYIHEQQVLALLSSIQTKTLLVKASNGLIETCPGMNQRIAAIQDLQQVEISGGHHLHMETPELVANKLNQFLDGTC